MKWFKMPARFGAGFVALLALTFASLIVAPSARAFIISGVGGTISIGSPVLVAGKLTIPVNTTATIDNYSGFNIHILFDGTLLSNSGGTFASGGALETSGGGAPSCTGATPGDSGNGVTGSCNNLGAFDTAMAGTLANIVLSVKASGCTNLHLFTINPPGPNNGNSSTGTYTINSLDSNPQSVSYAVDVTVDTGTGTTGCSPVAGPTATATATATNTAVGGATSTSTTTPTATKVGGSATSTTLLRTVTPTATGTGTVTTGGGGTPVPAAPGGGPSTQPTLPGGGAAPASGIRLPSTGNADSQQGPGSVMYAVLAVAGAGLISAVTGYAYMQRRRRSR